MCTMSRAALVLAAAGALVVGAGAGSAAAALTGTGQLIPLTPNMAYVRSSNNWATFKAYVHNTGISPVTLATVMSDTTYRKVGVLRYDNSVSGITGYIQSRSWKANSTDQALYYYPQGLTMTSSTSHDVIIGEKGVLNHVDHRARIQIWDSDAGRYHTVLLVRPASSGGFTHFNSHVGGVVQIGSYLYVSDFSASGASGQRLAVFDLNQFYPVSTSSACASAVGYVSGVYCGYGERWVLPVMNYFTFFTNDPTSQPLPMLDALGMDNYASSKPQLLTAEYCDGPKGGTSAYPCRVGSDAYSGRIYRFLFNTATTTDSNGFSDYGKIWMDAAGNSFATAGWFANAKGINGIATSLTAAKTYYLDARNTLFKVHEGSAGVQTNANKWFPASQGCHLDRSVTGSEWLFCSRESSGEKGFWAVTASAY